MADDSRPGADRPRDPQPRILGRLQRRIPGPPRRPAGRERRARLGDIPDPRGRRSQVLDDVVGKDILELGCGAAQWSIALARLGARPVGLDLSERQLEHARRLMAEAGVEFPLVNASAEAVPLPDASFDIVFCDHGAMTFADPYRTVPEAARLLRPAASSRSTTTRRSRRSAGRSRRDEVGERLALDYFGMHRHRRWRGRLVPAAVRGVDPAVPGQRASRSRTSSSLDRRPTRRARTGRPRSWPGRAAGRRNASGGCAASEAGGRRAAEAVAWAGQAVGSISPCRSPDPWSSTSVSRRPPAPTCRSATTA